MKNYLILHGSFGSCDRNWFPWLKNEIEKKGFCCVCPQMPIGIDKQCFESWSKVLETIDINKDTIIFAHSIAPVFAVKYLIENKKNISKLVSVAGFNAKVGQPDYDKVNSTLLIDKIPNCENLIKERVCVFSDNDPYVKFAESEKFASDLNARVIIIKDGKHLNEEFGYKKFEKLLELI